MRSGFAEDEHKDKERGEFFDRNIVTTKNDERALCDLSLVLL
jgi:hypothetical protein